METDVPLIMQLISITQQLDLRSMTFSTWFPDAAPFQILLSIANAIAVQPLLQELEVMDFQDRFVLPFQAAAYLRDLSRISFGRSDPYDEFWPEAVPFTPVAPRVQGFPSVTSISFGVAPEGVSDALRSITSATLSSLEVMVGAPFLDVVGEGDVPNVLVAIPTSTLEGRLNALARFPGLKSFQFTFATSQVQWADFAPILDYHQMEFACLQGHGLPEWLGNGELEALAQAWPLLQELELIDTSQDLQSAPPQPDHGRPPTTTLAGLACLAIHCPVLERLIICVDARDPLPTPLPTVVGTSVTDIRLSYSWVPSGRDEEKAVAQFLARMWPRQLERKRGRDREEEFWVNARWNVGQFGGLDRAANRVLQEGPLPRIWAQVYSLLNGRRGTAE